MNNRREKRGTVVEMEVTAKVLGPARVTRLKLFLDTITLNPDM
jgi:hypothetical protein